MTKQLVCKNCHKEFPSVIYIDGKRYPQYNRKNCNTCSPPGTKIIPTRNTNDNTRECLDCKQFLPLNQFSHRKLGWLESRCKNCNNNKRNNKRKTFKQLCIEYKGGRCARCGYNRCFGAMEFHHQNIQEKEFEITSLTIIFNDIVKAELDKCELLCSNCHREEHYQQ